MPLPCRRGVLLLVFLFAPVRLLADLVGVELFSYPDGAIDGLAGGSGFDFDARFDNGPYTGSTGSASNWNTFFGSAEVAGGTYVTLEGGAKREFNGPGEGAASDEQIGVFEDTDALSTVYAVIEMTRQAGVTWSGLAAYDLGSDSLFFGVPGTPAPGSGVLEFAIETAGGGGTATYSGQPPVNNVTATLVVKIDTAAGIASLFVDPDLNLAEGSNTAAATHPWPAGFGIGAFFIGSGGTGNCVWDNFAVATSWESLQQAFDPPVPVDETMSAHHGSPVTFQVLENDFGFPDSTTLVITQQPSLGSAIADTSGFISYQPPGGSSPAAETVSYRVSNQFGQSLSEGEFTIDFTTDLRVPLATSRMPAQPAPSPIQLVDALPGLTFTHPLDLDFLPNDPQQLVVSERGGRLMLVPDATASSPTATVFLDLAAELLSRGNEEIATGGENGFKTMAFHPDYANNGRVYVGYSLLVDGTDERARVSYFTRSTTNPDQLDPSSEVIMIDLDQIDWSHGIDCLQFGPDGYLYISIGDGGPYPTDAAPSNPQFITKALWSGISRIDVDKKPGSLTPNPHSFIVLGPGGEYPYAIPPDNPYLGATSFNGEPLDPGDVVRTEFYAVGLRNPWRISFDSETGDLWCGDAGQDAFEEIDLIVPGGNYGWPFKEALGPGTRPVPPGWTGDDPIYSYSRGSGDFDGASATGGILYRGNAYPQLAGNYVFGDYMSGHIWVLNPNTLAIDRLGGMVSPVSFGLDPNTEEILIASYGDGTINRLQAGQAQYSFPETLSETGLFADVVDLTPNPGLQPYDAILPFWSDNAIKERFFGIPSPTDTITFSEDEAWTYPAGTIWVKHFEMELTPGDPSSRSRQETRVLVKNDSGGYGVSYRWNSAQTEAYLVGDAGESYDLTINEPGGPRTQTWTIPSRSQCLTCHNSNAGFALSFRTRQLNMAGTMGPDSGNFLELLADSGYLSSAPPDFTTLPYHVRPDQTEYSLTERVRSYLDVNCSYCHSPTGAASPAAWDGRTEVTLAETGLINGLIQGGPNHPDDRLVVPGTPTRSVVLSRIAETNGYSRMPPLASNEHDQAAIQLLTDWIQQEATAPLTYQEWRLAQFASDTSPEGEPGEDPDQDGKTNEFEWRTKTNPLDPNDFWDLVLARDASGLDLSYPGLPDSSVTILQSLDLESWSPWEHPGNTGAARAAGTIHEFSITPGVPSQFFRAMVEPR